MTKRNDAATRILASLGANRLTQAELASLTGMSLLGMKSATNSMLKRKEIGRVTSDRGYLYFVKGMPA